MLYSACGLVIDSELALPALALSDGSPHFTVRFGTIDDALSLPQVPAPPAGRLFNGEWSLRVEGVARYTLGGRDRVVVDRCSLATDDDVRTFLLSSILTAVLHLHGRLPLHAAGVDTEGGAVLFAGASAAGKSALVAGLIRSGFKMICDDIASVGFDEDGQAIVWGEWPELRIWPDVARWGGWESDVRRRVRPGLTKIAIPTVGSWRPGPIAVRHVFVLVTRACSSVSVEPRDGRDSFHLLRNFTRGARLLGDSELRSQHFHIVDALHRSVPVSVLVRPRDGWHMEQLIERVRREIS